MKDFKKNYRHKLDNQELRKKILRHFLSGIETFYHLNIPFLLQIVSVTLSSPNFIYFKVDDVPQEDRALCYQEWPDADKDSHQSVTEYM